MRAAQQQQQFLSQAELAEMERQRDAAASCSSSELSRLQGALAATQQRAQQLERDKALVGEAMDMQKEAFDAEVQRLEQVCVWGGKGGREVGLLKP